VSAACNCSISIINAYAPNEETKKSKTNSIKTQNMPYGAAPSNITIVAGDFDTKVDKQRTYRGAVDMHGLHPSTTKKGKLTVNFTTSKNMVNGLRNT
jgi:hypothetical protein